jgi:chloramphenicol-sensitive protein RarD
MLVAISTPRTMSIYIVAAALLSCNWLVYVWGVNTGNVVETSLGYFINPLVSVALGVLFLGEKFRPLQWVPVGLAAVGVGYMTVQVGALPWIALTLAFSFGLYGLMKKVTPLAALEGLTVETAILFLPAVGYLLYLENQGVGSFGHTGWVGSLLLAAAGIVTSLPLLLFASATRRIPLSMIGLLQYIAPTCQFLLGVLVFQEPFSSERVIGFSIIWVALLIFSLEGISHRRRVVASPV